MPDKDRQSFFHDLIDEVVQDAGAKRYNFDDDIPVAQRTDAGRKDQKNLRVTTSNITIYEVLPSSYLGIIPVSPSDPSSTPYR